MKKLLIVLITFSLLFSCHKKPEELQPIACFDFYPKSNLITNDTIFFTNCSINFKSVEWDFGDGYASTEISPEHIYYESGTYKILQTIKNIELFDTLSEFITISLKYLVIGQDSNKTLTNNINILLNPYDGMAIYNLNLDFDNTDDLRFSVENQRIMAGICLWKSEIKVETIHDGIELIVDSTYLKVLSYGDSLKMNSNWGKNSILILKSNKNCEDFSTIYEGYWKDVDKKFIGFRLNDKRGWIKAGLKNYNSSLELYEYAIEK